MSTIHTILLFLFIKNAVCETVNCKNKSDGFYTDYTSWNCHSYYSCVNETLNNTFQCLNLTEPIFSSYRQRCVANNLLYDECYLTNITQNLDNCAWFSVQLSSMPNMTYHYSCLYPHLFDLETKECKHYSQVQCRQRFEPKDACDYHHPQIPTSVTEISCSLTPSCRNKTNGYYGNQLQDCWSYYECKDERFLNSMTCSNHTRFSDKYKTCLPNLINCENTTIY